MTITRDMTALRDALNLASWEWLQAESPALADALQLEVAHGATPDAVERFVMRHTGRPALAARCYQAAEYLQAQEATARTG